MILKQAMPKPSGTCTSLPYCRLMADWSQRQRPTCHDQCRSRVTSHHPPNIQLHRTKPPLCTWDSNRLGKHAVPGCRLVGGERAAPMRLPLVAGGEGGWVGGRCWWESCDITGTQSGVSHASTRATTICVSQHLITNQWSATTPPSQISRSGHMSTPPPPPLGGWGNLIDIEFSKTLHFVQEENEKLFQ